MTKSALVIGLGGTGQRTLTWLKRDLVVANNGRLPARIRLIAFDTLSQSSDRSKVQQPEMQTGGVPLDISESVSLGGNALDLTRLVAGGRFPQIGSWYHADTWLRNLPATAFALDYGATSIRQFGRLALYQDIISGEVGSKTIRALRQAIREILPGASLDARSRPEVILVGSLAGSTGSAMLIDMAMLARLIAEQEVFAPIVRAFITLPSAYAVQLKQSALVEAYACWRELNRFMTFGHDFPLPTMVYAEDDARLRAQPRSRLFDVCYLVGGTRDWMSIANSVQEGAIPVISEAIQTILDEQAGVIETADVLTNLAPRYAQHPGIPLYSAVGTFAIELPASASSQNLLAARELILELLKPARKFESGGQAHPIPSSPLTNASPDNNLEDLGFAGHKRSLNVLRTPAALDGKIIQPTQFFAAVAGLSEKAADSSGHLSAVDYLARGNTYQRSRQPRGWPLWFTELPVDPQYESLRTKLSQLDRFSVFASYGRRKGEREDDSRVRLRFIQSEVLQTMFGETTREANKSVLDSGGSYGQLLKECESVQLSVFQKLLQAHLSELLNGQSGDPLYARSGKLGYVWDLCSGLVDALEGFLHLMHSAESRRSDLRIGLSLQQRSDQAKRAWDATSRKRIFWIWEHPAIKRYEEDYLKALQSRIDARRDELRQYYVMEAVAAMIETIRDARDAVERWIWYLSTGDRATADLGILSLLNQQMRALALGREEKRLAPHVKMVIENPHLPAPMEIRDGIRAWEWKIGTTEIGFNIGVNLHLASEETQQLLDPLNYPSPETFRVAALQTVETIIRLIDRVRPTARGALTIGEEVREKYSAEALVGFCAEAEPLYSGQGSPQVQSCLVRVASDPKDPYFWGPQGLESQLRMHYLRHPDELDSNFPVRVTQSDDPHKLTIMRSSHLLRHDEFAEWSECEQAYIESARHHLARDELGLNPALTQVFSAEQKAAMLEQRMFQSSGTYRPLCPRVVTILDNPTGLLQAIYLIIQGRIRRIAEEAENPNSRQWELHWMEDGAENSVLLTRGGQPDWFDAIYGYVVQGREIISGAGKMLEYHNSIESSLLRLTREEEIGIILEGLSDDGLVRQLRQGENSTTDLADYETIARIDMSAVTEFLLEERLDALRNKEQQGKLRALRELWGSPGSRLSLEPERFGEVAQQLLRSICDTWQVRLDEGLPAMRQGRLAAFKIDVSAAVQGLLIYPAIPVLFLQGNRLLAGDIEDIRAIAGKHWSDAERIIFLFVYASAEQLIDIKQVLREKVEVADEYDVFVFNFRTLLDSFTSDNPQRALRSLILSGIHLKRATPFIITGPAPNEMFFGRKKELSDIVSRANATSFAIVGGRRMGKTSILRRLYLELLPKAGYFALYHDCSPTPDESSFRKTLLVNEKWKPLSPIDPTVSFGTLLDAQAGAERSVLLLDEVDELVASDEKNHWALFKALRALVNSGGAQVVLSGERTLHEAMKDTTSPLFNFVNEMLLGPLERTYVDELITRPMKQLEIELIDEAAVTQLIYDFTSGHPNVVQRLCRRLIERLSRQSAHHVGVEDVNAVIENPQFVSDDFLQTYLSRASALEHLTAILMAMDSTLRMLPEIHASLVNNGVNATNNQVHLALERLVDLRSILTRGPQGYAFNVPAFPRVIAQSKWVSSWIALRREIFISIGDIPPENAPSQYRGNLW